MKSDSWALTAVLLLFTEYCDVNAAVGLKEMAVKDLDEPPGALQYICE